MNQITLDGRVAVITGAGGGLGRAYATELARRGAAVVVNDIDTAQPVVDEILHAGGRAVASHESVSDPDAAVAIIEVARETFGTVDILINNAGIVRDRSFAKMSHQEIEDVLAVHLLGAFNVTRPAFRAMMEQGHGRLLFVTSAAGLFGNFGQSNYAAAKTGVLGLMRTLAIEGARSGITANAIAPLAHTPMTEGLFGGMEAFDVASVAPMAAYLVSDMCELTGEIFSVGGGRYARVAIGVAPGWLSGERSPSAERIAAHIEEILSLDDVLYPASAAEEIEFARNPV